MKLPLGLQCCKFAVHCLSVWQVKHLKFTFNLTKEDGNDEFNGVKLNRFAMQEIAGNVCYVTLRPPEKGSYLLVIYGKDSTDKVQYELDFVLLCSFIIIAELNS